MKNLVIVLGVIVILVGGFLWLQFSGRNPLVSTPIPKPSASPLFDNAQVTVVTENLDTPWAMVFLPDKSMLVTERPGRVRLVDSNGNLRSEAVAVIGNAKEIGEGGLLGIVLHPDFSANNYVYLYYTYNNSGGNTLNRVVRMTYQDGQLQNEQIIVDKIPGASNHNGGRIKFGSDGFLYITTGDAGNPSQAQDVNALAGKILRVTDEGKSVPDNPFNNPVYSYGHRNPQGLSWDSSGQLWATEHGRSGALSGLDELNLIEKGKNYGWPIIEGNETRTGMETAKLNSGFTTWAPAGAVFINNSLFFAGLRGESLYETVIQNNQVVELKTRLSGEYGRLREVVLGSDGMVYVTTSNKDGRGAPDASDDKILKVNPQKF